MIQDQKEAPEKRNYELLAQVNDVTGKLSSAKRRITRMNTGKAKLGEMLVAGRLAGVKTCVGYARGRQQLELDMLETITPNRTQVMLRNMRN